MTRVKSYKSTPAIAAVRCAVYTRKSTDEGLDQEFNSLDAQRESGEAYVASQRGAGWECLPDHYDDGGFTGGNMDRPALKRLMADIEAGKVVDCVVVYKVDRLSRSLLDFAKIMETFENHHVSGVALEEAVEHHPVEGVTVSVYSPAKTVADCFKYRNKIGLDVALEALRDCWKKRRATMDELWQAAKICRVANVMRPYLESLT